MNSTRIALGTWSWGSGAVGGDQVFGNHLELDNLKPVFDEAMKAGLNVYGIQQQSMVWVPQKVSLGNWLRLILVRTWC